MFIISVFHGVPGVPCKKMERLLTHNLLSTAEFPGFLVQLSNNQMVCIGYQVTEYGQYNCRFSM